MNPSEQLEKALCALRNEFGDFSPKVSLICGSGWGEVVEAFPDIRFLDYKDVPGLSQTTVLGHAGRLALIKVNHGEMLIFQGRRHFYEGAGWEPITFPVILSHALKTKILILTNAAGGISSEFKVGDIMLIEDHINMMGDNPLIGHAYQGMPRFPDQTTVYDPDLLEQMLEIGETGNHQLRKGKYLALSGPAFETPAEIKAYGKLGADAVGMSTVPEAMVGNALGMKILGLSFISNLAAGLNNKALSHDDVQQASGQAISKMKTLLFEFAQNLIG